MGKIKNVLVCGASGFIGRNISEYLSLYKQYNIHTFSHKAYDLTNKEHIDNLFYERDIDIIIQAAATTSGAKDIVERPYYHVVDNALMNTLLLKAAYDYNVKQFVFFSCSVVYDHNKKWKRPVRESDFKADGNIHEQYFGGAWTKIYNEKMCEFYSKLGKTKFIIARHSNVYGQHDKFDSDKSHVFAATISKVNNAKDGDEIVVWGDGSTKRDFIHISDLCNFVYKSLNCKNLHNYEIFNVGSGSMVSVKELVNQVIACSKKRINVRYDEHKPQVLGAVSLDSGKAYEILGWKPKVTLTDGIRKTLRWHKERSNNVSSSG